MVHDLGISGIPFTEHPQGFRRMSTTNPNAPTQKIDNPLWMPNSCQELENAITETRLRVAVAAPLRWNVASAVVREDPAGTDNWIFDKRKATGRIDGLVALAMGVGAAKYIGEWKPPSSPWDDPNFSILAGQGAANG
jgi:phage terminase large subunit-like protein